MKCKVSDLVSIRNSLSGIAKTELPAKIAYRLARLNATALTYLDAAEKQRTELLEKFGEKVNNKWAVKPEHAEAFQAACVVIYDADVEIAFTPVSMRELNDVVLTVGSLSTMLPLFTD